MTWYRSQIVAAIVVALFAFYSTLVQFFGNSNALVSIHFAVNGFFVFPGLLLAFGVNQVLLSRRDPHVVTAAEQVMLGILYGVIALSIMISFIPDALFFGFLLWPILILLPITLTIVIAVTSHRLRRNSVEA